MTKKVLIALAILLLLVLAAIVPLVTRQAKPPVLVSRTDPPKISFEETTHELGTVSEGVEVPYVFKIHNVGGEPLIIQDVTTSCGCTLLNLKDKYIEPGKTGDLEVIMDTTMKQGHVKKQIDVFSNDPENPKLSIFLAANVVPSNNTLELSSNSKDGEKSASPEEAMRKAAMNDPHAGLTPDGKAKIFTGRCATCHVLQGKGKLGGDLYQADCAMCHGQNGEGGVGSALVPGDYHDPQYVKRMTDIIRYGSKEHRSMPGFLIDAGGPLTEGEINSIVLYLQNKSDQVKAQQTQRPGG